MKIDKDILRIAHCLLDEPANTQGMGITTVYSSQDKLRHPHLLTYKHPNTIPRMAEMGILKILKTETHGKPVGMEIQIFPYYKVRFSLKKIKEHLGRKFKRPSIKEIAGSINEFKCGKLKINLSRATMQYKNNPLIEISPDNDVIKFLVLLMKHKRVLKYIEIARNLKLNCYHEGVNNKDVARAVQFLKRDSRKILKRAGVNQSEIKELIIAKKNVGYKLLCE